MIRQPTTSTLFPYTTLFRSGMEEGEQREIAEPEFELLANRPVSFPLLTATDRSGERAGEIVGAGGLAEIGRASCRERVEMSVVAGSLKKKKTQDVWIEKTRD